MDVIKGKIQSLKIQNAVLVIICVLFIYLLRVKEQYTIAPAWHTTIKQGVIKDTDIQPSHGITLPRPIVTDLDGDSQMEIILVSQHNALVVAHWRGTSQSKQIPQLTVRDRISLPAYQNEDGRTSQPVTMETGYFTEYQSAKHVREQFIVIVMDNWNVLCFNHKLNLMWQQKLMDVGQIHNHFTVKAMSVLIAPVHLHRDDEGVIVVGASFGHKDHNTRKKRLSQEEESNTPQHGEHERTFTHFSTFALSGSNGTVRWHHLPGDFEKKSHKEVKAHHWKLEFKRRTHHIGEAHWSKYQPTLLKHMPHLWNKLADTKFDLADIKQAEDLAGAHSPTPLVDILGTPEDHLPGYFYGGEGPHSRHEHVRHPNALVIHNDEGIEVLRLQTGQPITRLRLAAHKAIYVDVNEDGSLEQLLVSESGETCHAHVSTIHPKPRAVFSVPVCEALLWSGSNSYFGSNVQVINEDDISVPPVLVKSVAKKRGFVNHLLGRTLHSERRGYDSIYVTSFGRVTSYSSDGDLNWQTISGAQWVDQSNNAINDPQFDHSRDGQIYHNSFLPSAVPMSTKVFGKKTIVIVSGWARIALIDLKDGHVLVEHSLPCQPSDEAIATDFTTDGFTDIIVTCPQGYLGFTVQTQPSYFYMVLVSITVILSVMLLSWCCQPDHHSDPELNDDVSTYNIN